MARTTVRDMIRAIKASADQPGLYVTYSAITGGIMCVAVKLSVIAFSEKSSHSRKLRRMAELINVLGAPAAVLVALFWKIYSQIASRRLLDSIADPDTKKSLTDILYLLRCVDCFQNTSQTDIDAWTDINRALLRGALAAFVQPSSTTLNEFRGENFFAELTSCAAFDLRLERDRNGSRSWLIAIPLSLVVTLIMAGHMSTAIILISMLISLVAIGILEIVYDFDLIHNSESDRVCGQLLTHWLSNLDPLHLTASQAPKDQRRIYRARSTAEEPRAPKSHILDSGCMIGESLGRNMESYTIQYKLLKGFTNPEGYDPIPVLTDKQADIFRAQLTVRPSAWFATWMFSQRTVDIVFFCLLNSLVKAPTTDAPYLKSLCMVWYLLGIFQWLDVGIWQKSHISVCVVSPACNTFATICAIAIILVHIIDGLNFYFRLFGDQFDSHQQTEIEEPIPTWLLPMVVMFVTHTIGFLVLWWNVIALTEEPQGKLGTASIMTKPFYFQQKQKRIRPKPTFIPQDQEQTGFKGATMRTAQGPPEVQGQYRHVTWQCACGAVLSDVYYETVPGSLRVLQQRLQKESVDVRNRSFSGLRSFALKVLFKSVSGQSSGTSTSPDSNKSGSTSTQSSKLVSGHREIPANSERDTTPSPIPQSTTVSASTRPHAGVPQISYLLLCLPEAWAGLKLYHQQLVATSAKNDFELFRLLRQVYGSRRSVLASALSLRTVVSVSFAHFLVDLSHYVDLKPHSSTCQPTPQDCKCLPPQDMLVPATSAEYWCHPTQPEYVPPIGPNYLTHCFRNPNCVDPRSNWVLNQVPKRVSGQLMVLSGSQPARGWGLSFEEGWDRTKIRNGLFGSVILGTFVFGILWSVFKKDIQSAYGVSAYVVSVLAIIGAYLGSAEPRLVSH